MCACTKDFKNLFKFKKIASKKSPVYSDAVEILVLDIRSHRQNVSYRVWNTALTFEQLLL